MWNRYFDLAVRQVNFIIMNTLGDPETVNLLLLYCIPFKLFAIYIILCSFE